MKKKKQDRCASRHPRNLQNGKRQDMAAQAGNRNWNKPRGKNIIKVPNHPTSSTAAQEEQKALEQQQFRIKLCKFINRVRFKVKLIKKFRFSGAVGG